MSESLTPDVVTAWRRRAGASETPGPNPTRQLHRVGAAGIAEYIPALEVTPLNSAEWEEYAYWRPLSVLVAFALLRTPCATGRSERLIGAYPSDFVVVATQRLPMSATLQQDGRLCSLSADDRLVITDTGVRIHTALRPSPTRWESGFRRNSSRANWTPGSGR